MLLDEPAIALELTERAAQLAPGYPKLDVNKGCILAAMGDYSSARRVWQSVVRQHPNTGRAHYNLGNLYLRSADYTRAVECYDRCLTAESDYVPAWINKAIALTELGHLDLAEDAYETAVGWSPGDAQVHYNFGVFLCNQGRLTQAKDALLTCVQLDPRHKAACNYLGNCSTGWGASMPRRPGTERRSRLTPDIPMPVQPCEPRLITGSLSKQRPLHQPGQSGRFVAVAPAHLVRRSGGGRLRAAR